MMMAADPEQMAKLKGKFRVVSSAGEPLNPEVFRWFKQVPMHHLDHYGQTEVGMVVCNHHGLQHDIVRRCRRLCQSGISRGGS